MSSNADAVFFFALLKRTTWMLALAVISQSVRFYAEIRGVLADATPRERDKRKAVFGFFDTTPVTRSSCRGLTDVTKIHFLSEMLSRYLRAV